MIGNGYDGQVAMQFKTNSQCYFNHKGCSFITTSTLDAVVKQLWLEQEMGNAVADLMTSADRSSVYKLAAQAVWANEEDAALADSHTTGWSKTLETSTLDAGDVILITRSN